MQAVPFFQLLDREILAVAKAAHGEDESNDSPDQESPLPSRLQAQQPEIEVVMAKSRQRLSRGVDSFVRSLPTVIRNDSRKSRAAAYALVGLADEKMLHYPAGGLEAWRDRLLEVELYGSALAGQEIIHEATDSIQGYGEDAGQAESQALFAPLYLALLREGFEGSLRGDPVALSTLTSSLEETIGAARVMPGELTLDEGPKRRGISTVPLVVSGVVLWLLSGFLLWMVLAFEDLKNAGRVAERIEAGLPALQQQASRPFGPSRPPAEGEPQSQ